MVFLWICLSALLATVGTARAQSAPVAHADSILLFVRTDEASEHAFNYLLPYGWIASGGVVRRDPLAPSPDPRFVAPQLDFTVERDSTGSAMIRWLPNVVYCDLTRPRVPGTEVFPVGSTYQGMLVYPRMSAQEYLKKLMISSVHPDARYMQVLDQTPLPSLSHDYDELLHAAPGKFTFHYDAASLTISYEEGAVTYKERWLTVIEDWGEMGGGQWGNKETVYFRAPVAEFDSLRPIFEVIQNSVTANPEWVAAEMPQDSTVKDVALKTRRQSYDLARRVSLHRPQISNSIRTALFGESAGITRFLNPFTGSEEQSPRARRFRWVDPASDALFTNDSLYVPDLDGRLEDLHFRRCEASLDSLPPSRPHTTSFQQN